MILLIKAASQKRVALPVISTAFPKKKNTEISINGACEPLLEKCCRIDILFTKRNMNCVRLTTKWCKTEIEHLI